MQYLFKCLIAVLSFAVFAGCSTIGQSCIQLEEMYGSYHASAHYTFNKKYPGLRDEKFVDQSFTSMQCGFAKGTIYYFRYESEEIAKKALSSMKVRIWGDTKSSPMHSDLIEQDGATVIVVTGRQPKELLQHAKKSQPSVR